MLEDADLDAAVAEGIVSPAQATALREIAARRTRERAIAQGHEERFRFMSGFNDFFFSVGVVLFIGGLVTFVGRTAPGLALTAAITWALAEYLVGRLRLVLPGIILASCFALLTYAAVGDFWFSGPPPPGRVSGPIGIGAGRPTSGILGSLWAIRGGQFGFAVKMLCAGIAAGLFFLRFRLPFALLLLAGGLVGAVLGAASLYLPDLSHWAEALIVLTCGLAVFVAAMAFDTSDRERLTRRADSAFWLHLLAAPLIMHSLVSLVTNRLVAMNVSNAATIVLIIAVLALAAIAIDRRALLVSGLSYLGIVIAYAVSGAAGAPRSDGVVVAATLVILGAFVLALGVGWMPLRRRVMSLLSPIVADRLPPVPAHP